MKKQDELQAAYDLGYEDGQEMARESGTADAPADGWDGSLINAVGQTGTCQLLGECPEQNENGWTSAMLRKLATYSEGAIAGANAAISEKA